MTKKEIKAKVRERDGHKCVDCGRTRSGKRKLAVHRLVPGSEYHIEGCVTVCPKCHVERHRLIDRDNPRPLTIKLPFLLEKGSKIRELRARYGQTQKEFTERLRVDVFTLRYWEQGRGLPSGPARILLDRLEQDLLTTTPVPKNGKKLAGAV